MCEVKDYLRIPSTTSSAVLRPSSITSATSSPKPFPLSFLLFSVALEVVTVFLDVPVEVEAVDETDEAVVVVFPVSLTSSDVLSFLFEHDANIREQAAILITAAIIFFIIKILSVIILPKQFD